MVLKEPMMLLSCPNCGGDDAPWFCKAEEPPEDKPFIQTCGKCNHTFFYGRNDVVIWPTLEPLSESSYVLDTILWNEWRG